MHNVLVWFDASSVQLCHGTISPSFPSDDCLRKWLIIIVQLRHFSPPCSSLQTSFPDRRCKKVLIDWDSGPVLLLTFTTGTTTVLQAPKVGVWWRKELDVTVYLQWSWSSFDYILIDYTPFFYYPVPGQRCGQICNWTDCLYNKTKGSIPWVRLQPVLAAHVWQSWSSVQMTLLLNWFITSINSFLMTL